MLSPVLVAAGEADAAELLMFEQAGCPFCRKFDEEIAPDYPQSRAGIAAPLRRVDIGEDRRGGYPDLAPAVFTPTFVLVDDSGKEVGRLQGYPGKRYFYPEIAPMIADLSKRGPSDAPRPTEAVGAVRAKPNATTRATNENGASKSSAPSVR